MCMHERKQAGKTESRQKKKREGGMRAQFVDSKAHETHNLAAYLLKGHWQESWTGIYVTLPLFLSLQKAEGHRKSLGTVQPSKQPDGRAAVIIENCITAGH